MAADDPAAVGAPQAAAHRFPGHHLLGGAQTRRRPPGRDRPRAAGNLRQAGHPAARAGGAGRREAQGRRGGGRRVRFRERDYDLPQEPGREGHHLLLLLRGGARASGPGAQVPGERGARGGQLLRGPELRGLLRRVLLLHPQGGEVPDGPVQLLPHQRFRHRPVRAHADHRRRRLVGKLYGRLHRADARREPAATAPCRTGIPGMRRAAGGS